MFSSPPPRSRGVRIGDAVCLILGFGVLVLLTTYYQMPFRLDDVLHMDWARDHSLLDAFHAYRGEIVRSVRPVFAIMVWILTHTAGTESYFAWHLTLVGSFLIGLAYTGLTARYIARRASALYFTVSIFWIAFLPILNVLFWFGDLTFSIELMFVAAAWYYGLRGLCEGSIGKWVLGCFLGACAVLSKEPAIVMVNAVFVGTFLFYPKEILSVWKRSPRIQQVVAVIAYLGFLSICIQLFFASPTRSNRFFDLTSLAPERLNFFISDRLRYYGDILAAPIPRLVLLLPLYYLLLDSLRSFFSKYQNFPFMMFAGIASFLLGLFITQPLLIIAIFICVPIIAFFSKSAHGNRALLLLPFAVCMVVIFSALLITVMLVKTQLTEFAFCAILVSGTCWSYLIHDLAVEYRKHIRLKRANKVALAGLGLFLLAVIIVVVIPKFASREALLREVQATRSNANDAIKWMAKHLPPGSTVLLTAPSLYGSVTESDLTAFDDETKAFAQYTFLQGYVRVYFRQLDRPDIKIAYLEDSTMLKPVLEAFRTEKHSYVFLQSGRDWQRFHSRINAHKPITTSDSLAVRFDAGSYASEVWKLQ